ncbi:hypothetical protein [Paractinoplanes globisporus]|uniref:Uncharacterized protein n=1 Tax=Paractinoplanes globisporus TaxID=113565 RepID=A0ABW6WMX2_9ACTN|nr:hypothetical protein [Actinoplanes globisporus]
MSDAPRDPGDDEAPTSRFSAGRGWRDSADEPVTGAPAGASSSDLGGSSAWTAGGGAQVSGDSSAWTGGGSPASSGSAAWTVGGSPASGGSSAGAFGGAPASAGSPEQPAEADPGGATPVSGGNGPAFARPAEGPAAGRRLLGFGPPPAAPGDERQRRRRRWFIVGIAVAAAVIVVAICAGGLSIVSTIDGARDRAADAREARAQRETDCLDLERRLNRLVPPGSTSGPAARATAIRDENSAVRIYVDQLDNQRDEDAWRQLLDARTVYADALDRQAKSRTPAFYVAPRTTDGLAVTDELAQWSPASCAGAIRRLAAPEL